MSSQTPEVAPPRKLRLFTILGVIFVVIVLVLGTVISCQGLYRHHRLEKYRGRLSSNRSTPLPPRFPSTPGTIIRTEPLDADVPGGTGFRVLYSSVGQKGEPVAVSGMMFISNKPAPPGGRPVIGWAHGTVGLAPQCAPSRSARTTAGYQRLAEHRHG